MTLLSMTSVDIEMRKFTASIYSSYHWNGISATKVEKKIVSYYLAKRCLRVRYEITLNEFLLKLQSKIAIYNNAQAI